MTVAIVTGGSRGLGRALTGALAGAGWSVVTDGRDQAGLQAAADQLRKRAGAAGQVVTVPGDVADPGHRRQLVEAAEALGGLDLVVNNASTLGTTPLPALAAYPLDDLRRTYEVNTVAPLALVQAALTWLRRAPDPRILNVTSDAGVQAYEGWGGYGSSKAALEQLGAVLAVEEPGVRVWTVDPGDMRTQMHQEAFPGEDISDRPRPEVVVPALLDLVHGHLPSGRYRVAGLLEAAEAADWAGADAADVAAAEAAVAR